MTSSPSSRVARFDLLFAPGPTAARATARPRARLRRWSRPALVVVLTALAAALRLHGLGDQSFSTGEAAYVVDATRQGASLHGALLRATTWLLGASDGATRALSALAGTLTVPLAYAAARHLAPRGAALAVGGAVALAPLHVALSQDARPHALLVLAATAAALAALRAVGRARIAAALGAVVRLWHSRRRVVAAACALAVPVAALAMASAVARPSKTDWRAAVRAVESRIRPGDLLLFDGRAGETAYLRYALRADDRLVAETSARDAVRDAARPRRQVWLVLSDVRNERGGRALLGREWRERDRLYARGVQAVLLERRAEP